MKRWIYLMYLLTLEKRHGETIKRLSVEVTQLIKRLMEVIPTFLKKVSQILAKVPDFLTAVATFLVRMIDQFIDITQYYWDEKMKLIADLASNYHTELAEEDELYLQIKCEEAIRDSGVDDVSLANANRNVGVLKGIMQLLQRSV